MATINKRSNRDYVRHLETIEKLLEEGGGGGGTPNAVKYTPQSLTSAQQEQARTNIGSASASALSQKQDTLVSGTNIKTLNNQSLLGSGNITIDDQSAVKYTEAQSLSNAQKATARGNIAAASLADINNTQYVKAAIRPEPSENTVGPIYLIGPDANDEYERYFTQESNGTYTWVALGSTEIHMDGYATDQDIEDVNDEISHLEAKVDELDAEKLDRSELIESETLYQESAVTTDTRHYVTVTPIVGQSYELKWANATPNVSWIQLHTMNSSNQTVEILANINKAQTASGSVIVKPTLSGSVKFLVYLSGATADITLQKVDNYLDKLGDRISDLETEAQEQGEDISTLGISIQKESVYAESSVSTDSQHRINYIIYAGEEYELSWANATANSTRIQWKTINSSNAIVENLADINKVQAASGSIKVKISAEYAPKFLVYLTGTTADITIKKVVSDIGGIDGIYKKEELPFETGYFLNVEKDANGYVTLAHDTANPAYMAALVECRPGDVFLINSVSGTLKALPFTFVDENNKVIYQPIRYSTTGRMLTYVTTPVGATKIAVNTSDRSLMSYKISGVALLDNIKGLSLGTISKYQDNGLYDSFRIAVSGNGGVEPTIVSVQAKYTATGDEKPTIQFLIGDLYKSTAYVLGGEGEYKYQQFRIPPMVFGVGAEIIVTVPESCTLTISAISASADFVKRQYDGFIGFDAHLGFSGIAPSNTMAAFELAAISGYNGCVCNPISGESGKLYCYHGGQSSLTQDGVTAISYSVEGFHALTDAQIGQLKVFGFGNHRYHYLEHLPTLEEFFALCSKTGMRPVFSTHGPLQSGDIAGMKSLAEKYNLTDKLTIKSFDSSILENAFAVFADSIYGYVYDIGTIVEGTLENAYNTMDSIVPTSAKCRRTIEIIASQATDAIVSDIIDNGFKVGVYSMEEERDGRRYLELIGFGVTMFTDDNTPCTGLSW